MNYEKNKFAFAFLNTVKENMKKNRKPIYNPIFLSGLTFESRRRIFDYDDVVIDCKMLEKKLKNKDL